ncbi:MAG TPA: ABC transporter permease, partial [Opitutaceae bacterium]
MRFALRQLLRTPGFTLVAVAMLALGIGANTAIFSLINAFFLRGLPVDRPEELIALYTLDERNAGTMPLSHPNYLDYRDHNTVFSGLAAHWFLGVRHTEDGVNTSLMGEIVSGNYFDVLGVSAALGRTFAPDEYARDDTHPVVVLSHSYWLGHFGGRTDVLGRTMLFNNVPFTVIGVAPEGFRGLGVLNSPNFWITTSHQRTMLIGLANEFFHSRRAVSINVVGRLKPGVTLAQAGAALAPLAKDLAQRYPEDNGGRSLRLLTVEQAGLNPNARADVARAGTLLISLTGIVLLIACANLANLLLARAAARQREITLRIALGASRARVVRELMLESAVLTTFGAVAGILLAFWLKDLLWALR